MGMYDYINGEQVKVFYTPIFDENCDEQPIWHSGGIMDSYCDGDEVSLKTYYYNRPKNFIIVDEHAESDSAAIIHIIKNGKVYGTFCLKDVKDEDVLETELVIDYHGHPVQIGCKEDIYGYLKAKKERIERTKEICKDTDNLLFKYLSPLTGILGEINRDDDKKKNIFRKTREKKFEFIIKNFIELKNVHDISNNVLRKLRIDSIDALKQIDIADDSIWSEFKKVTKEEVKVVYDEYMERFKESKNQVKPILEELFAEYSNKWIPKNQFKLEERFGEFLFCFLTAYERRNDEVISNVLNPGERYLKIKKMFKNFIDENPTVVDSYIKWLELDDEGIANLNSYLKLAAE